MIFFQKTKFTKKKQEEERVKTPPHMLFKRDRAWACKGRSKYGPFKKTNVIGANDSNGFFNNNKCNA